MVIRITVQSGIGFSPPDLSASVGDAVFWYNEDPETSHQVYPKGGAVGSWGDPVGPECSSMQVNLDTAGTYAYVCAVAGHEDEQGTIVVS
jgi:plastocyanin